MAALRVTVVKPDWGIRGGAEQVLDHLEGFLRADGHYVDRRSIPVPGLPRRAFGLELPDRAWNQAPEYFRYLAALDAVRRVDVSRADVVISTHGPSFAVNHPRHLNIFFHHLRVFYDLEEVYVAAGLAGDPEVHAEARRRVRSIDRAALEGVTWFSPNSEVTQARLLQFNGLANATVHHAGIGLPAGRPARPTDLTVGARAGASPATGAVLCASRSEFTKRTELFVEAMHLLGSRPAVLAGDGSRLPWVRQLDADLAAGRLAPGALDRTATWCNTGQLATPSLATSVRGRLPLRTDPIPPPAGPPSPVTIAGRVSDHALGRLLREAPCVVAPAYDEDYGLTALEAMAHGKPVVVCRDGGGLATVVEHDVNGLVVEPTARAIAAAVARLVDDPELAQRLGRAGRATAATFTWQRCATEFRQAFEQVAS